MESFHPCYLLNVKQEQIMLASVASVKWNAAQGCVPIFITSAQTL